MPLTAMNDYVDGLEQMKLGYGIPEQYPLGINGLGADCEAMLNDPAVTSRQYIAAGCSDSSGTASQSPFGPFAYDPKAMVAQAPTFTNVSKTPPSGQPAQAQATPAGTGNKWQDALNALTNSIVAIAPAFKKAPKQKTVYQKDPPDNTVTYAVIGGAVVVAGILAIAIGKSGRRRD